MTQPITDKQNKSFFAGASGTLKWLALSAILFGLSFPPVNFWVLAYFALIPMTILATRTQNLRQLSVLTWFVSFIMNLFILSWMMMVTVPGYFVLCAYVSLYPLCYIRLIHAIDKRARIPLTFSVPLVWVALEYLKGAWLIDGFPWFLLGHSQPTIMIQIADLVGAYGVSFVVAMFAGLIAELLTHPLVVETDNGMTKSITLKCSAPVYIVIMLATLIYGFIQLGHDDNINPNDKIKIAVIQTNIPQSNKNHPSPEQNLKDFQINLGLTTQSLKEKPDLVIWPETMVPHAINNQAIEVYEKTTGGHDLYRKALDRWVITNQTPLIVGAHAYPEWEKTEDGYLAGSRFNSAYLITPVAGQQITKLDRFDKIHRVPFGEYIPWLDKIPWAETILSELTPYNSSYTLTPGKRYNLLNLIIPSKSKTFRIGAPICYEDIVSYVPRLLVYGKRGKRADILVNLSNDNWYAATAEPAQHEQMARFRCVENRIPMARAVNGGISSFIDSSGRILQRCIVDGKSEQVAGYSVYSLSPDSRLTLFGSIGDAFAMICLIFTTILWILSLLTVYRRKLLGIN